MEAAAGGDANGTGGISVGGSAAVRADVSSRARPLEREYARIVERHRDELHAHSRRILRSSQDAEDALQEALLRAWRALPSFEGRSSLRSWLQRIVTNTSLDEAKRRPKRVVPIDVDQATPADNWQMPGLEPATEGRYLTREDFERSLVVAMRVLPSPAACGPDPARGARLLRAGDGEPAGDQRRRREQPSTARPRAARGEARRAADGGDAELARGRAAARAGRAPCGALGPEGHRRPGRSARRGGGRGRVAPSGKSGGGL